MERRHSTRSPVSVSVFISLPGKPSHHCKTRNLSSRGVYLSADVNLLPLDAPLVLFFAVKKHRGSVIQIHRMTAKIVRIGADGVAMTFCRHKRQQQVKRKNPATVSTMRD